MRIEYDLMGESVDTDSSGRNLPDIMTLNLNNFEFTSPAIKYQLTENDIYRFDKVMLSFYSSVAYYAPMVLMLNNIPFLTKDYMNEYIFLPIKEDLDNFYQKNFEVG